ncbi:acylhydrolase [Flavobacterium sp. CYK-55]|uniref:GDSL-type esterase/lipase family protein n=1 Tax=Flavobacterium sp. CYK-55 TaxID=2835529 RepID=UPI001BCFBDB2|nr:GDSL-type esterase/lipase family protein [Flavobacterium sp. CYK-55]MBS7786972.1 acylhydrolase [Flavobacterium sp. CYK-55]
MKNIFRILTFFSIQALAQVNAVDYANFDKYKNQNTEVINQSNKIILMGDSITEGWIINDADFFAQNHLIDRGISGQTTSQMLLRFRNDVIDLHPKKVVILAGINDIAENSGPISTEQIFAHIKSMCDLAKTNQIKVILCTVLPAAEFPWRPSVHPIEKVLLLNQMIRTYAQDQKIDLVDYFLAMKDPQNALPKIYSEDGVHPNKAGYEVMKNLLLPKLK